MGWVKEALKILDRGQSVRVRPYGGSMRGIIESGQLVELIPSEFNAIKIGDVVLVKWKGNYILHLVKEIAEDKLLIGNNLGKINGWVAADSVIAKVSQVFDKD